jgi:hypothetical protein
MNQVDMAAGKVILDEYSRLNKLLVDHHQDGFGRADPDGEFWAVAAETPIVPLHVIDVADDRLDPGPAVGQQSDVDPALVVAVEERS